MYMPKIKNRSWKFVSLLGVFYITISNVTLLMNNYLSKNVTLKENLENLAFLLSPEEKNKKKIEFHASKIHKQITLEEKGYCSNSSCKKTEKRTFIFCSKCKKYFHKACFDEIHAD